MASQPFYHLRPNKSIDRNLFVQTLIGLTSVFPVADYWYTGFGSYMFDDFKILHERLNFSRKVQFAVQLYRCKKYGQHCVSDKIYAQRYRP